MNDYQLNSDFGARYYDSDISMWLSVYTERGLALSVLACRSVDPMSDFHSDYSPYAYVYNNPLNYIDPFGLDTISAGSDQTIKSGDYIDFGNRNIQASLPEVEVKASREGNELTANDGSDSWAVKAAAGYMVALQADLVTPDPTDAAWPKWVGHAVLGTASAIILYSAGESNLNPNIEGTTTSRGNPTDWSFDPEINRLQNDKYYPPGSKPPKWFWPAIGAAGAYELYKNWPKQKIPQPTTPVDNTYVAPPVIFPLQ